MKYIILITTLAACNVQTPSGEQRLVAVVPEVEPVQPVDPVVETHPLDTVECIADEAGFDSRVAYKFDNYFDLSIPLYQGIYTDKYFTKTEDFSDIEYLESLGLKIEYLEEPWGECSEDSNLVAHPFRLPSEGFDLYVYTGACTSGYYEGETTVLNMADQSRWVVVPSIEIREKFKNHMTCSDQ